MRAGAAEVAPGWSPVLLLPLGSAACSSSAAPLQLLCSVEMAPLECAGIAACRETGTGWESAGKAAPELMEWLPLGKVMRSRGSCHTTPKSWFLTVSLVEKESISFRVKEGGSCCIFPARGQPWEAWHVPATAPKVTAACARGAWATPAVPLCPEH